LHSFSYWSLTHYYITTILQQLNILPLSLQQITGKGSDPKLNFIYTKKQEALIMKRLLLTLAIALGLAFGSFALTSSDVQACNGKDKGATTEDTTGTSEGAES